MDGCITNDGDAFLYGARTVYKDLFTSEVRSRYSGIITSSTWYCHHHRLAIGQNWLSISASQSVASVEQRAAFDRVNHNNTGRTVTQFQASNLLTSSACSIIIRTHADEAIEIHFCKPSVGLKKLKSYI